MLGYIDFEEIIMPSADWEFEIETEIDRARRRAANWERELGRDECAKVVEAGTADDSAIVRTMRWLNAP